MTKQPGKSIFSLPLDLFKAFTYTFRVFSAFMKEARQITFSDSEEESIDEQIKLKARKLLQTQVENYGSKVITPHVEDQVKQHLNKNFLAFAQDEANQAVSDKIESLLQGYLKQFDLKRITRESQDRLEEHLNTQLLARATTPEGKPHPEVDQKIEYLLLELLEATGQNKIFRDTKARIDAHLNQKLEERACSEANREMQAKIEELTGRYITSLTQAVLTEATLGEVRQSINQRGLAWTNEGGAKQMSAKAQELFLDYIEALDTGAIAAHATEALKEVLSQLVEEIGTTAGNIDARAKAEALSTAQIKKLTEADIDETTTANVITHVNQELLKYACDHSNEIIKVRLTGILQELVNTMGAHSLYPETENAIKLNLNTRAVELAQIEANEDMLHSAETLLKLYLKESNKSEVVDQESMASIKKALNEVIVRLMQQTGKIESEAQRVFDEILENCGPDNIDPLVRMKIESVLYKVLVKQLAVYGNKELTNKALELIREVAQNLPHDSSTNDLIMSHKARQPETP